MSRLVCAGAVVGLVACSAPARHVPLPPFPTCGWVHPSATLPASATQHTVHQAIAVLHLDPHVKVLRTEAARAEVPFAVKVGLPTGPRVLWLIYTLEPIPTPAGGGAVPVAPSPGPQHLLHLVDDATLSPAGATVCSG